MIAGNFFNFHFINHMLLCWKYNLCVVCIFQIESDEEIITNERILSRHVISVFPVQLSSWLWPGRKWFKFDTHYTLKQSCAAWENHTLWEETALFKQWIVSAVKNILFCSRLTLLTHRHLGEANLCYFMLKFTKKGEF